MEYYQLVTWLIILLIYLGVTFFACKMKDPPSSLYFFLKKPILQRETFLLAVLSWYCSRGGTCSRGRRPHNPFQAEGITVFLPNTSVPTDIATLEMMTLQHYSFPNCDMPTTHNLFACARYSISFFQLCLLSSLMAHQTLASKATTNWVHLAMLNSGTASSPALQWK